MLAAAAKKVSAWLIDATALEFLELPSPTVRSSSRQAPKGAVELRVLAHPCAMADILHDADARTRAPLRPWRAAGSAATAAGYGGLLSAAIFDLTSIGPIDFLIEYG
jgi:hypothetical protein